MTSTYGEIVDSRELLSELRDLLNEPTFDHSDDLPEMYPAFDADEQERVTMLRDLLNELPESTVDSPTGNSWGSTLVAEHYFTEYARELASDIGAISGDEQWPLSYINWEAAAGALKADYVTVELDGVTYYAR